MTWRWSPAILVVGAAALTVFASGAGPGPSTEPGAEPPSRALPVGVAKAELVNSFLRERVYTGTLVARRRSVISFERGGKLIELLVDEGARVDANQTLARLDTRRLSARRAQAMAELDEAKTRLDELVAGPRKETIAAARAEVVNLNAQSESAKLRLSRRERLVASRAVSREEYDEARFDYQALIARVDSAQHRLDELLAGTRAERVEAQRARVAALEAQLADIVHETEDAVLLAPYAGRIVRRRVDEGAVVAVGDPVFELIEEGALEAWIGLPPRSAAGLETGQTLPITIDQQEHNAIVQSVRPELDPTTRTQNVVLRLEEPKGLVAGRVARVALREPVALEGYWAPTQALTPDRRGLWSLLVVDSDNRVAARPVEVIENDGQRSFVRGALLPGERLLVEGAHRVAPGQIVTPVEKPLGRSTPD